MSSSPPTSRKRRSSLSDGADAALVPSKQCPLRRGGGEGASSEVLDRLQPSAPAQAEGAFPNLARVLQRRFSGLLNCSPVASSPTASPACEAKPACRPADNMLNVLVRAVVPLRVLRGATEPRAPNRRPEYADPRRGPPPGSARESRGASRPLPRGPERDSAPGEPSLPVWSGDAEEPGAGGSAFPPDLLFPSVPF